MSAAKIRTELCGLPQFLSFPPKPPACVDTVAAAAASSRGAGDEDDVWSHQLRENRMMDAACRHIERLTRRAAADAPDEGDGADIGGRENAAKIVASLAGGRRERAATWTIFDLQELADGYEKSLGEDIPHSLLASVKNESFHEGDFSEEMLEIGRSVAKGAPQTWTDALLLPHRTAAVRILSMYNKSEPSRKEKEAPIRNYLFHHAARVLEQLRYFALPSLEGQLLRQEKHRYQLQQRHKHMEKLNNDAFEQWDDYCMNVMRVESDSLPLFPECFDGKELGSIVEGYARQVGEAILVPMTSELARASKQFLQSLVNTDMQDSLAGNVNNVKCFGKDIAHAISYYRQFVRFLSMPVIDSKVTEDHNLELSTLYQFTMENKQDHSTNSSLLSRFTTCPMTRANLVGDLQQLKAFVSSRKRELSSRLLLARSGRDVVDSIELQWIQHCMRENANFPHPQINQSLESISSEDVSRFHSAACNVSMRIAGDGAQARRLRFLADAVGLPSEEDVRGSSMFRSVCRKAACLAHEMTLCQNQQEAITKMVELCVKEIGSTKEEILSMKQRVQLIRKGLNESLGPAYA